MAPGDDFYLRAFSELGTERQMGMAIGPIPWSKRCEYARKFGLEPHVEEAFHEVIKALDCVYLEWQAEEMKVRRRSGGE